MLTDREYSDYVLRLEFSLEATSGAGIAMRAIPGELLPYPNGSRFFDHPMIKLIGNPGPEQTGTTDWVVEGIRVAPIGPPKCGHSGPGIRWKFLFKEHGSA